MTSKECINKMVEKYSWLGKEYCRLIENENPYKPNQQIFEEMADKVLKDLDRLEQLEKENQELKELVESLHKEQIIQAERIFDLEIENTKLKEVIKFLGEQLDLDVDLENHNLITDEGTIAFVNADEETMSILELLREVIE